jgi:nitrite reductase/ring-hydroxylating ferredoxin subunit
MLTHEQNELLCRVGPGTPMGTLARSYWLPLLRCETLLADGAPQRIRVLGENFVAFRATDGRVGLIDEACPHRGVSMALARNGDCALTCLYHGWKIGVDGQLLDAPSEPVERREKFIKNIPVRHFPVREAAGVVWAYFGGGETPKFPDWEFNSLPPDQVKAIRGECKSNWLQGFETVLDSAHLGILHKSGILASNVSSMDELRLTLDMPPVFKVVRVPYGLKEGAIRGFNDGTEYTRVREIVLPFFSFIPMRPGAVSQTFCYVPIDDYNHILWTFYYHADRPLEEGETIAPMLPGTYDNFAAGLGGFDNMWRQDRARMEQGHWSGLPGTVPTEDVVIAESMGPIVDRSKEHLGTSDVVIAQTRRRLLEMLREQEEGTLSRDPADRIDYAHIRGISLRYRGIDWSTIDAFNPPENITDPIPTE